MDILDRSQKIVYYMETMRTIRKKDSENGSITIKIWKLPKLIQFYTKMVKKKKDYEIYSICDIFVRNLSELKLSLSVKQTEILQKMIQISIKTFKQK